MSKAVSSSLLKVSVLSPRGALDHAFGASVTFKFKSFFFFALLLSSTNYILRLLAILETRNSENKEISSLRVIVFHTHEDSDGCRGGSRSPKMPTWTDKISRQHNLPSSYPLVLGICFSVPFPLGKAFRYLQHVEGLLSKSISLPLLSPALPLPIIQNLSISPSSLIIKESWDRCVVW